MQEVIALPTIETEYVAMTQNDKGDDLIADFYKVNTKPVVLFLLSISLAKSASTNLSNFKSLAAKHKQVSEVSLKYLIIHFTTS